MLWRYGFRGEAEDACASFTLNTVYVSRMAENRLWWMGGIACYGRRRFRGREIPSLQHIARTGGRIGHAIIAVLLIT